MTPISKAPFPSPIGTSIRAAVDSKLAMKSPAAIFVRRPMITPAPRNAFSRPNASLGFTAEFAAIDNTSDRLRQGNAVCDRIDDRPSETLRFKCQGK